VTATYSAPITSKILLEAGYAHKPEDWGYFTPEGLESFEQFVGITNQATVSSIAGRARTSSTRCGSRRN
jgi:hypothetical protein